MKKCCLVISLILQDQKLGKCWKRVCMGTKVPHSILVHDVLAIKGQVGISVDYSRDYTVVNGM